MKTSIRNWARWTPLLHAAGLAAVLVHGGAYSQVTASGVVPRDVAAEPSTPTSLAVRWPVAGDRNLDARIRVEYRKSGAEQWSQGYPLFRTFNDRVSPENAVSDGHLFAGSVVGLDPDTDYDLRLSLEDRDGGSTVRLLSLRTAPQPALPADMRARFVVALAGQAAGGVGSQTDPFRGLSTALKQAQPGDRLELAAGTYDDGPYVLPSGTHEKPIALVGAADGAAVLDGRGGSVLVEVSGREHVWLEGLTLRNALTLVQATRASHIVVTRSRFDLLKYGFRASGATYRESVGFRVTDNVFAGSTKWPRSRGIEEVYAVAITGSGHVVGHNLIQNVGDGVHNGGGGRLSASDIHNNDIDVCTDDGIEADYSDTNVRIFHNRITNCFAGVSLQPVHGGPVYVYRNTMLNLEYSPFKLHNDTAGSLFFHNTSVKAGIPFAITNGGETVRDVITRNNLFVGTAGPALYSNGVMSRTDFDNDGYEWPLRASFAHWNGRGYGMTRGSRQLYSEFGAVPMGPFLTFAGRFGPPRRHSQPIDRAAHEPRLAPASRAIDRGVLLPNFNDRFAGSAPDLGCCELGEPLPVYGVRPPESKAPGTSLGSTR